MRIHFCFKHTPALIDQENIPYYTTSVVLLTSIRSFTYFYRPGISVVEHRRHRYANSPFWNSDLGTSKPLVLPLLAMVRKKNQQLFFFKNKGKNNI